MPRLDAGSLRVVALFLLVRSASLVAHFNSDSPFGGPLVESASRFLGSAILIESFCVCLLCTPFVFREATRARLRVLFGLLFAYNVLAQIDLEVQRWMNQQIRFAYLWTYRRSFFGETNWTFLSEDPLHTSLALVWIMLPGLVALALHCGGLDLFAPSSRRTSQGWAPVLVFLSVLAALGTSPGWFMSSKARFRRVKPVLFSLSEDLVRVARASNQVQDSGRAGRDLHDIVNFGAVSSAPLPLSGGLEKYPLVRPTGEELEGLKDLKDGDFERRPHVFLLVIESWKGWDAGMTQTGPPSSTPYIDQLARDSVRFPYTHSVGFPSVEGAVGIHLGLFTHPQSVIVANYLHVSTLSFTEILRAHGYEARILLGTEPSFDNLTPWFRRWYDEMHFASRFYLNDEALFRHARDTLRKLDWSRPQLMTVLNSTSHTPYRVPKDSGIIPAEKSGERYKQAMAYLDQQVQGFVSELKALNVWDNSVVVLVGDHSQARAEHRRREDWEEFHAGYTWTPLVIGGGFPLLPDSKVVSTTVSHVDVAPTLLELVGVHYPHHFVGRALLRRRTEPQPELLPRPAYSLRFGMFVVHEDHMQTLGYFDGSPPRYRARSLATEADYGLFGDNAIILPTPPARAKTDRITNALRLYGDLFEMDRIYPREWRPELPVGAYVVPK